MSLSILLEHGMAGWNFMIGYFVIPRQCTGLSTALSFMYVFIHYLLVVLDTNLHIA